MGEVTSRMGSRKIKKDGVFYMLSAETKPTIYDGASNGDSLFIIDTSQAFLFYDGTWREL
jgi:hypothetical protein